MDLPELRKRLRFWKKELNLQGWTIYLRLARAGELPHKHAEIEPRGDHDKCRIVIHEGQYAEFWLTHELLHAALNGLCTEESKAAELIEEIAVNRIARALCHGRNVPCPPWKAIGEETASAAVRAPRRRRTKTPANQRDRAANCDLAASAGTADDFV